MKIRKVTMDHYSLNRLCSCWSEATATFILDEIEVGFSLPIEEETKEMKKISSESLAGADWDPALRIGAASKMPLIERVAWTGRIMI